MAVQAYTAYFILHPLPDDDTLNHLPATLDKLDNKFFKNYYCDNYNNNHKIKVGLIYPHALVPAAPFTFSCYAFVNDALVSSYGVCTASDGIEHSAPLSLPWPPSTFVQSQFQQPALHHLALTSTLSSNNMAHTPQPPPGPDPLSNLYPVLSLSNDSQ
eukprot:6273210-Ditylum_brightwellii.AAC.1